MHRTSLGPLLVGCAWLAWPLGLAAADPTPVRHAFEQQCRPLLDQLCLPCHRAGKAKGGLDLEPLLADPLAANHRDVWRQALGMIRAQEMPPTTVERQPSDEERAALISWLVSLRTLSPPDPGLVPARRLTRFEYDRTIADLFGVDWHPAADFPADDVHEGFDNQGEALSVSPLLMEKYLSAVTAILDRALVAGQLDQTWSGQELAGMIAGKPAAAAHDAGARMLTQTAELGALVSVPRAGQHQIRLRLGGEGFGNEPPRIAVKIDGQSLGEIKATAPLTSPRLHTLNARLTEGGHRITIVFLNPGREEAAKLRNQDPKSRPAAGGKNSGQNEPAPTARIRTLLIDSLQISGPTAPRATEVQKRLVAVRPGKELNVRAAAQQNIQRFAARAFRRPPTPAELALLMQIFDLADSQGEVFEESLRLAFKATLLSPQFLFRIERDRPGAIADAQGAVMLDDFSIASRLSYFLWSTMPDEELLSLAATGRLQDEIVLREQVRRLLSDPRSRSFSQQFAGQWLQVRGVFAVQPDNQQFPGFDQPLRQALFDEAVMLFDTILREQRPLSELIAADYSFLNERSAAWYGIPGVSGSEIRRVPLSDPLRGGVLGLGAMLASTSNPTRTSPVKRGKWVLEQLLDRSPATPPTDVPPLDQQASTSSSGARLSLRQRMERHRSDPTCAGCHATMDAIGFGLELYDPLGRTRTSDDGIPIDASGSLGGQPFAGPAGLKEVLTRQMADIERGLARKLLIYALGRGAIDADEAVLDRIIADSGHHLPGLIAGIVTSYPFRYRKAGR